MITEPMVPMIIVPLVFLFVLLIILIAKAPKTGAWIVGGLVLVFPLLLFRLAMGGALAHEEAIPLVVLPLMFLFVLLVILLAKVPKIGVGLVVALVAMVVLGLVSSVLFIVPSRRSVADNGGAYRYPSRVVQVWPQTEQSAVGDVLDRLTPEQRAQVGQQTEHGAAAAVIDADTEAVYEGMTDHLVAPSLPPAPVPAASEPLSPIWSEGVEQEFDADVYPSRLTAARALGSHMDKAIRELTTDGNSPSRIVLFQQEHDRTLVAEFKNGIQQKLPEVACSIEAELRNIQAGEIGVTLRLTDIDMQSAPWAQSPEVKVASGRIDASVSGADKQAAIHSRFAEKPWIADFAGFANARPQQSFIIARSVGSCTSEGEADRQAQEDARRQLTEAIGRRPQPGMDRLPRPEITTTDVLAGGFIVDRFAQSFAGSAGRIWRQALLIDVSGPKLARLTLQKTHEFRQMRESWARMGFSVIGVIVLIGVIYFFLNMATMGYYEWSLRIAGMVLAIVAIISVLMVVR